MPVPVSSPAEVFRTHYEDARTVGIRARLGARLRTRGLVTLDGLERRVQVLDLVRVLMALTEHPDSDPDGLTVIRDTGRHQDVAGAAGLGHGELLPHTERSGAAHPPRLMLLACTRPAHSGGVSTLVDGRAVHADLARDRPEALEALSATRSAFFGGGNGHLGAVFADCGAGRVVLRLRQDALARFSPEVTRHLPALRDAIDRHRVELFLGPGQAFLLDNHRWLHARSAFVGPRHLHRALGNPLTGLALLPGFQPIPVPESRPVDQRILATSTGGGRTCTP